VARVIFQNANLLDGDSAARPNATVVVSGQRIESVSFGPGAPPARPDDRVVDVAGRTLMPGLVCSHYHSAYRNLGSDGVRMPVGMNSPVGLQGIYGAHNMKLALDCGFTGAVSAGSANGIDAALKMALDEGVIVGPRLVACGRDVSTTGHSQDRIPYYWQSTYSGHFSRADGADGFRRAVREEVRNGAEMIKLFVTGGHGVATPAEQLEMTPEELRAAIEAAHAHGARIRGHIANGEVIRMACEMGMDIIDHGDGLDERGIELLVEKDIGFCPSLLFPHLTAELRGGEVAERIQASIARDTEVFHKANDAGVRMLAGDDYGVAFMPHGMYADELVYYVENAGFSALDVIRWATKNGGELLGFGKDIGTIAAGKYADLLVVAGDPSRDIKVLKDQANLHAIMKDGVLYKDTLDRAAASQKPMSAAAA